jgi:hypothetical protein
LVDGKPACPRCGIRPKRWDGKRWQSYCVECRREYKRDYMAKRRRGMIEILVTPEEFEAIKFMRHFGTVPGQPGRHRR